MTMPRRHEVWLEPPALVLPLATTTSAAGHSTSLLIEYGLHLGHPLIARKPVHQIPLGTQPLRL